MKNPRGSLGAARSWPITVSILPLLFPPLVAAAQEKPKTKPTTPHQQIQKQSVPGADSKAQKDPVEERYRAAETFQLAGDLKSAEGEYRRVISLALQRMAALQVLAQDIPQALVLLQSATAADPSDLEAQMGLASLYSRSGDLAHGKAILLSVLAQDEHHAGARNLLGKILFMEGDYAAAADQLKAAWAENPEIDVTYSLALAYLKLNQVANAANLFDEMLTSLGSSAELHVLIGRAYQEGSEFDLAIEEYRKALTMDPAVDRAHSYLGTVYLLQRGDAAFEDARAIASSDSKTQPRGLPLGPESADEIRAMLMPPVSNAGAQKIPSQYLTGLKEALGNAYHNLGVILAQRSQYQDAANLFAEAGKWSPDIKALDKNWGTASFRAHQYKVAIGPLERHLLVDPQDSNARQMLALSYFMTDDFPKAAATFRPILPTLPNNPSLLYAAGISLAKSGDSNGASEIFNRMLAQNPDAAEVHLFLGQAHAEQKQGAEALKEFSRALELNPKMPEANYGAGMIHLKQGNREQAESDFRAELAVNPRDASAEFRLGYILLAQQRQPEAIDMLGDVVRQKPNDADAHYVLGKALLEKGDLTPAIDRLETAIRLDPGQPNAYYQLSLAYRRQGRAPEAEATLRQYEKLKQKNLPATSESESGKPH